MSYARAGRWKALAQGLDSTRGSMIAMALQNRERDAGRAAAAEEQRRYNQGRTDRQADVGRDDARWRFEQEGRGAVFTPAGEQTQGERIAAAAKSLGENTLPSFARRGAGQAFDRAGLTADGGSRRTAPGGERVTYDPRGDRDLQRETRTYTMRRTGEVEDREDRQTFDREEGERQRAHSRSIVERQMRGGGRGGGETTVGGASVGINRARDYWTQVAEDYAAANAGNVDGMLAAIHQHPDHRKARVAGHLDINLLRAAATRFRTSQRNAETLAEQRLLRLEEMERDTPEGRRRERERRLREAEQTRR